MSGLAGVIAGESAICTCGLGNGLNYRGYDIADLALKCEFEEVAYLLLNGELPNKSQLEGFRKDIIAGRELPQNVKDVLKAIPATSHPMDVMKTATSALGCCEPEADDFSDQEEKIKRLLGAFPSFLVYWHHWHKNGKEIELASDETNIAGYILERLKEKTPEAVEVKAMNAMLTLYAEHEFNASTFANRITASTLSDIYSCMTTGIGTLKGHLHGGANEVAIKFVLQFDNVEHALKEVDAIFARKEKIMGFGHRVYRNLDPRSPIGFELARELKELPTSDPKLFDIAKAVRDKVRDDKGLPDNIDFFGGLIYHYMQIERLYYTPLFIMSRAAGWAAHAFEQRANNRIIRPGSEYTGPAPRDFVPMEKR
ncbi:citrate/2-methylcitrate synthase [Halarcobacter anaerophilus]|jgi:2-methylcitrate synthase|uniref:Citrate synthase n=1 Tax=Halarcobacter anaerophilus TaxID=877500 RepID=A0A4Q0XZE8_9BACT|nr:citrate/2-methylcitrate synthase [Halarcobacter anaerophilus]QDF30019.1 2-methylcitrate synthase [Halarcobacter anaerophilus]RXJ63067.1 2-methylcitrate synthase [Halarcobacter anaerophilus]